jgi:hypothetical protein
MKKIHYTLQSIGLDFKKMTIFFKSLGWFFANYRSFKKKNLDSSFQNYEFKFCLFDKNSSSGSIGDQYLYQDIFVANKIFENNPNKHVDVGSRIDGFISAVGSFREVEIFDIRPLDKFIHKNISFTELDFTLIPSSYYNYTDSISCLHTIEHVGLGRYGDNVDPTSYINFFNNLSLILNPGGKMYISTPIGKQKIVFNAHRVFGIETLLTLFSNKFKIISFSYMDDDLKFYNDIAIDQKIISICNNLNYGLSIFELEKI